MTVTPQAAVRQYREQQRLTAATVRRAARLWRDGMDPEHLDFSFRRRVLPDLMTLVTASQMVAAESGAEYVPRLLDELNIGGESGEVVPQALSGIASNGGRLDEALAGALWSTKSAIRDGQTARQALVAGRNRLESRVQLEVADAGRMGASVAAVSNRRVKLYVRMLVPPSCSRCALLAGQTYAMETAFARHPRCDCKHIPANEDVAGDLTTDPHEYFQSLSEAEQNRLFTNKGAEAIRDGADIFQVVNARRGMYTTRTGGRFTTEATSRRGMYGSSQTEFEKRTGARMRTATRKRPMPETIYALTKGNREETIRLLKYYRYIL